MPENIKYEFGHHHEHQHNSHHHDHSGQITPEILKQLEDKSDSAKITKLNSIIAHTTEVGDDADFKYKKGLGYFYLGKYELCMKEQEEAFPYFDGEMGVAAIYWHTIAAWKCGKRPRLLEEKYNTHMDVGHHTAYNKAMAVATGVLSPDNGRLMLRCEHRPLEYSIFAYGFAQWLKMQGNEEESEEYMNRIVADERFWITYSYLAAWNEKKNY